MLADSVFVELPGGVLLNVSHLDAGDVAKLFGRESVRARSEEFLTPTKPKGARHQRPQKKEAPAEGPNELKRSDQVIEGFELGRKEDPAVEALSYLPALSQCSSTKQYVRERTEILRICSPMRCALEEHLQAELTKQVEQRAASRSGGSVTTRDRHQHTLDRIDRHKAVLDNRRRVLQTDRAHAVEAVEQTEERIRKAAEGKAAAQAAQELAHRWFSVTFMVKTALKFRECRARGYAVKWKSIAVYLIAKYWRKRVFRRSRRLAELKLNLILRRYIPSAAEHLRETKRKVFLATVKHFLFDCAVTKQVPNLVHSFLTQVKRAQRVVRRRQLSVRLQSYAMLVALNNAFFHQELESRFTPTPEFVRAEACLRLTRKDREVAAAEKRDFLEKLQNNIETVDKVESQRIDAVLLGQSIIVHSSLITLVRCVPLSKVHRLQRLALAVEHEKSVSPELRDLLKRWFAQFYLRFTQLAGNAGHSSVSTPRSECEAGRSGGAGRFPFLSPEGEDKFLLDALRHAQAGRPTSPSNSTPLAASRGGSLVAMARACSQFTVPFLNKSDLVWSVLSQVVFPQRPRRRRLLAAQTMSALAKLLRDEWDKACRAAMLAVGAPVVPGAEGPLNPSPTANAGALDAAVVENTAMLQSMAASYSSAFVAERSIARDVLMSYVDWSFLDKFYRRVR